MVRYWEVRILLGGAAKKYLFCRAVRLERELGVVISPNPTTQCGGALLAGSYCILSLLQNSSASLIKLPLLATKCIDALLVEVREAVCSGTVSRW